MKLTQKELYAALGELISKIEGCGASTELTNASSLACDIHRSIGNQWNKPDEYSAKRVRTELRDKYTSAVLRVFPDAVLLRKHGPDIGDQWQVMSSTNPDAVLLGADTCEITAWYSAMHHNSVRYHKA